MDDIVDLASLSQTVGASALLSLISENQDQKGTPDIFQPDTHYKADNHLDNSVDLVNCLLAEANDALNARPDLDSEPAELAAPIITIEAGGNSNITGINYASETNLLIMDRPRNKAQHDYKKLHTCGFSKIAKTVPQHGIIVSRTYEEAIAGLQKEKWLAAMKEEVLSQLKKGTFRITKPLYNEPIIPGKWDFRIKKNPNGSIARYKARWVAKDYMQVEKRDYKEKFAPVVRSDTSCILLSVAATRG